MINLRPDQELIQKFGPLAYVDEQERQRILSLPFGQFKPAIKQLEKQIKQEKKRPQISSNIIRKPT